MVPKEQKCVVFPLQGFQEIHEANIFGSSFDDGRPNPSSEWQAKRPLVQCHDTTMILMASGEEYAPLFVDRGGRAFLFIYFQ